MRGYYDLSCKPATFDFSVWLTTCRTIGVTEVVFDVSKGFQRKKFSQEVARGMYENVLIPMAEIWGFKWSEGSEGDVCPGYKHSDALENQPLKLMEFELGSGRPTVTIRQSIRNNHRDSNTAWREFAKEIDAIVIEDAYRVPLSLKDRIDLYRNASMNYFCSNGPGAMLFYTNIPYTFFSPDSAKGTWGEFPEGTQLPWASKGQRIFWENDTLENIRAVHPERC